MELPLTVLLYLLLLMIDLLKYLKFWWRKYLFHKNLEKLENPKKCLVLILLHQKQNFVWFYIVKLIKAICISIKKNCKFKAIGNIPRDQFCLSVVFVNFTKNEIKKSIKWYCI